MHTRLRWLALGSVLLTACGPKLVTASTQVMLRVYNDDPALLAQMRDLSVSFALRQNGSWHTYPKKTFAKKGLSWPVDIPIIPTRKEDRFKQFEVVVRALSGATVLAETRAVSSFVPDQRRVLEVWLYSCEGHDPGFACAEPNCHGELCSVCQTDGTCRPVGASDPHALPPLTERKPESKPAPPPSMDGGVEAGAEGGTGKGGKGDGGTGDGGKGDGGAGQPDSMMPVQDCSTLQCNANARCVEGPPAAHCECFGGYHMVNGSCEDIDECAAPDRGGCSVNATCDNKVGGRVCTCKSGFTDSRGDGTECVDKCATAGCAQNATCSIVSGNAECACLPAYVGEGRTSCTFDSQCSQLHCDPNATCVVSGSDRICQCKSGYTGDGTTCTNPDA